MERILPRNSRKRSLDAEDIGGKGLGLYRLAKLSRKHGYDVPDFFIVPTEYSGPEGNITLRARYLEGGGNYAVRSSSPYEDSKKHSFAGIFKTNLDVPRSDLIDAIRDVKSSATSEKALKYAQERGIGIDDKMAVIIQRMVDSEIGGVVYTTLPSFPLAASVEFCAGSPKDVVDGTGKIEINDFDKWTLKQVFESEETLSSYDAKNLYRFKWTLGRGKDIKDLVRITQQLEKEFGYPLDIEFAWTYDRGLGKIHLLQARAITDIQPYKRVRIPKIPKEKIILESDVVRGIGKYEGPAAIHTYVIHGMLEPFDELERDLKEINSAFPEGYVLFVPNLFSYADYDGCTPNKRAIVEYSHSLRVGSHALAVAREKGVLYMGKGNLGFEHESYEKDVISKIKNGDIVKVVLNGRKGIAHKVRNGNNPLPVDYYK